MSITAKKSVGLMVAFVGVTLAVMPSEGTLARVGERELNRQDPGPRSMNACDGSEQELCTTGNSSGAVFRESFNARGSAPRSAMNRLGRWFAQPVHQPKSNWALRPGPMHAQHGPDCAPPPAVHHISTYEETVFLCKDHLMTAIDPAVESGQRGGNAAVILKPNHLVDLSKGEARITVDVSTKSPTNGDWWEIWITPWSDQLVSPADHFFHYAGPPKNAVALAVRDLDAKKFWSHQVFKNFAPTVGTPFWKAPNIRPLVPVSDGRRDTYEVRLTTRRVRLLVKSPLTRGKFVLVDEFRIAGGFPAKEAVVQFAQSNYEPALDGKFGCEPPACKRNLPAATWHWDNVRIAPARPYRLIGVNEYMVWPGSSSKRVSFKAAAPVNARMLFNGYTFGNAPEISFDNGVTWRRASAVRPPNDTPPLGFGGDPDLLTYTVNVPKGRTSALVRGRGECTIALFGNCDAFNARLYSWMFSNFHIIARPVPR